jgi:hypothetical protein
LLHFIFKVFVLFLGDVVDEFHFLLVLFQVVFVCRLVRFLSTRVTESTVCFNNTLLLAILATSYTAKWLIFSIVKLPLQQQVTFLTQVIHRGLGKLFGQFRAFIVFVFKVVLMLLALLADVSSLR